MAVHEGYLLLADISGYTEFLTKTEIDHSHEIIRELTDLIRDRLTPPMRFVKLEGDAVFCYADHAELSDGERVLELIERCYLDFGDRLFDMARSTTCGCRACASIAALDLKFVTHFGSYVVDLDDGRVDLSGADVILAHRLLKNSVVDDGGPAAYALFSGACVDHLPADIDLAAHSETYEGFGETTGAVLDVGRAAQRLRDAREFRLTSDDADISVVHDIPAPPAVVWQYFVDPVKRGRWVQLETGVVFEPNEHGRVGAGASSHCAHGDRGDALREYLDWRPTDYVTCRFTPLPGAALMPQAVETWDFYPRADGGTDFTWRIRAEDRSAESLELFAAVGELIEAIAAESANQLRQVLAEDEVTSA